MGFGSDAVAQGLVVVLAFFLEVELEEAVRVALLKELVAFWIDGRINNGKIQ